MSAALIASGLMVARSSTGLDTQTVTSGGYGTAVNQDRERGFVLGFIGTIVSGTSSIYGGAAIGSLYWSENGGSPVYYLSISGATNTGWTTLTINGTKVLYRTGASFSSGTWTWIAGDTYSTQAFGNGGSVHTCVFA